MREATGVPTCIPELRPDTLVGRDNPLPPVNRRASTRQVEGDRASRRAVFLDRDGVINQVVFRNGMPASPRDGQMVDELVVLRANHGRLFVLGVGGSAANASHSVNDFRKLADIEAYAPTDNVSELTARINDDGWESSYAQWLKGSRIAPGDAILVLSVGGGSSEKRVSMNLVEAVRYARPVGARVYGVVGRHGGYTALNADVCVLVPSLDPATMTPQTESFESVVLHLIVSHPNLLVGRMKWEPLGPLR